MLYICIYANSSEPPFHDQVLQLKALLIVESTAVTDGSMLLIQHAPIQGSEAHLHDRITC